MENRQTINRSIENNPEGNIEHQRSNNAQRRRSIDFAAMTHDEIQNRARHNANLHDSNVIQTISFSSSNAIPQTFEGHHPPEEAADKLTFYSHTDSGDNEENPRENSPREENIPTEIPDIVNPDEIERQNILQEYNRLNNHELARGYRDISERLGTLAAQDDILLSRIGDRRSIYMEREQIVNEHDELVDQFNQTYIDYAKAILLLSVRTDRYNRLVPIEMRIAEKLDNHIQMMNDAFDEEANYSSEAFEGQDWYPSYIGPLSPLRLEDTSSSENEN